MVDHEARLHRVGTTIGGRYRIDEVLAKGAAGTVYKAYRQDMERTVALKVLNSEDANLLERFKREIKATAKLQHPNIISIFEAGKTPDDRVFYAMEYLDGATLRDILEGETTVAYHRVFNIVSQLAAALGAAHSMGIVHRNLNPDDLMIAQQAGNPDFCTILDFGVARIMESESELTMRGEILGQPEYFAPETLSEDEVGPAADIYAVGCIAYECLVGKPPFQARPRMRTVWMHVKDPVPPFPDEVTNTAPKEFLDIVMWMLEKDPAARPRDGRALGQRLDSLEITMPRRTTTGRQVVVPPPEAPAPPAEAPAPAAATPAPAAPAGGSRDVRATPFSNRVAASRPNSQRPLARGQLLDEAGKRCTFMVRGATPDAIAGSALAGSASMNLTVGAPIRVAVPVDRQGSRYVQLGGVVAQSTGAPPELVIHLSEADDPEAYQALVAGWAAQ